MESLFHNNKCFLDKITEENNTLKFIYISRDNKDKIIEKKEEIYNIEVKGVFKYVTVGIFRYEIISKEKSLKNKLEDKNLSSLDFSTCIFLLNENFEGFSDRILRKTLILRTVYLPLRLIVIEVFLKEVFHHVEQFF